MCTWRHPPYTRLYDPNNVTKMTNYEPPDYAVFFTQVQMFPSAPSSWTLCALPVSLFQTERLQV